MFFYRRHRILSGGNATDTPPSADFWKKQLGGVSVKNFFIKDFLSKTIFWRFAPEKKGGTCSVTPWYNIFNFCIIKKYFGSYRDQPEMGEPRGSPRQTRFANFHQIFWFGFAGSFHTVHFFGSRFAVRGSRTSSRTTSFGSPKLY